MTEDTKDKDGAIKTVSKGYGFVAFSDPDEAREVWISHLIHRPSPK